MVTVQVPFVVLYILAVLAGVWFLYELGDLVLCLWDRYQYKKKEEEAAEWLAKWGA